MAPQQCGGSFDDVLVAGHVGHAQRSQIEVPLRRLQALAGIAGAPQSDQLGRVVGFPETDPLMRRHQVGRNSALGYCDGRATHRWGPVRLKALMLRTVGTDDGRVYTRPNVQMEEGSRPSGDNVPWLAFLDCQHHITSGDNDAFPPRGVLAEHRADRERFQARRQA
ncbi:hypothetical protein D3C87_1425130 [compost metagenome]